jgi:hypothetical protein
VPEILFVSWNDNYVAFCVFFEASLQYSHDDF